MKLNPVNKKSQQDYPAFDEYWTSRRKYLSEAALCAGLVISTATMSSCSQGTPQVMGEMVAPNPPQNSASTPQPQPPGEIVAPEQPGAGEPVIMGKMKMPTQPKTAPIERTPMIDGDMPVPVPPERTPALRGDMVVPEKPEPNENLPKVQ